MCRSVRVAPAPASDGGSKASDLPDTPSSACCAWLQRGIGFRLIVFFLMLVQVVMLVGLISWLGMRFARAAAEDIALDARLSRANFVTARARVDLNAQPLGVSSMYTHQADQGVAVLDAAGPLLALGDASIRTALTNLTAEAKRRLLGCQMTAIEYVSPQDNWLSVRRLFSNDTHLEVRLHANGSSPQALVFYTSAAVGSDLGVDWQSPASSVIEGARPGLLSWVAEARSAPTADLTLVHVAERDSRPAFTFKSRAGSVFGSVLGLRFITQDLAESTACCSKNAFVFDGFGNLVASSDTTNGDQVLSPSELEAGSLARIAYEHTQRLGSQLQGDTASLITAEETINGAAWYVDATSFTVGLSSVWRVVVLSKQSAFFNDLEDGAMEALLWAIFIGVAVLLVTVLVTHWFTRPFVQISQVMDDVSTILQTKLHERKSSKRRRRYAMRKQLQKGASQSNLDPHATALTTVRGSLASADVGASPNMARFNPKGTDIEEEDGITIRQILAKKGWAFELPTPEPGVENMSPSLPNRHLGGGPVSATDSSRRHSTLLLQQNSSPRQGRLCSALSVRESKRLRQSFGRLIDAIEFNHESLQRANTAKRQFLRYIFHEVRVPLNAVVLGVDELVTIIQDLAVENAPAKGNKNGAKPSAIVAAGPEAVSDMLRSLEAVQAQCDVVSHILDDVLSMSKIEDGQLELEMSPMHMERMLHTTITSFARVARRKNIRLLESLGLETFDITAAKTERESRALLHAHSYNTCVIGDPYRLRQVVANFLSNALKFTPSGGEVHLSMDVVIDPIKPPLNRRVAADHPELAALTESVGHAIARGEHPSCAAGVTSDIPLSVIRISVADQGVGIPADVLPKLFRPYQQIASGELQKGKGTGLGLSISKSIVELHGGHIYVDSAEGEGATFTLEIPFPVSFSVLDQDYDVGPSVGGELLDEVLENEARQSSSNWTSPTIDVSRMAPDRSSLLPHLLKTDFDDADSQSNHSLQEADSRQLVESRPAGTRRYIRNLNRKLNEESSPRLSLRAIGGRGRSSRASPAGPPSQSVSSVRMVGTPISSKRWSGPVPPPPSPAIASNSGSATTSAGDPQPDTLAPNGVDSEAVSVDPSAAGNTAGPDDASAGSAPAPERSKVRVLVAEDSRPNRRLLVRILERMGLEAFGAADGQIALELFEGVDPRNPPFDVVLMDGTMPNVNGYEATARIRSMGVDIPIIAVTGNALDGDKTRFIDAGASLVLTKPVRKHELSRSLGKYFDLEGTT